MNQSSGSLDSFALRRQAVEAPPSGIVAVVDHARTREGLIPLWVGEGDLPTPEFISRPAADALLGGETFYTWQQGIPPLREALARYFGRHFGIASGPRDYIVVGSGMQAIQLAIQAVAGAGDECVY
ncbi:MAG: aminotransferase class I/II-fold pyridoxal phosphate-dependent enzyme, partial [Oricola sp.]